MCEAQVLINQIEEDNGRGYAIRPDNWKKCPEAYLGSRSSHAITALGSIVFQARCCES
jgi:hypothetical protein